MLGLFRYCAVSVMTERPSRSGSPADVLAFIERYLDDRQWVTVPILFAEGRDPHVARMELPADLHRDEAERVKAMLDAWVV